MPADRLPDALRSRVLARALATRPAGSPPGLDELPTPTALLGEMVDELDALLGTLSAEDWHRPVTPYDWTVHGLVAHLAAVERHTASLLGLADATEPEHDHLALTVGTADPPALTRADWRRHAELLRAHPGGEASVELHGLPMTVDTLLVVRAFEIWTHTDDVRRATAQDPADPTPPAVRVMSATSVGLVECFLGEDLRVVLGGPGGGTWTIGPAPSTTLVIDDAVAYCRYVAQRVDRSELVVHVDGDATVADRYLDLAAAFAV